MKLLHATFFPTQLPSFKDEYSVVRFLYLPHFACRKFICAERCV